MKGVYEDVDFVRLVENGAYKKENLSATNFAFVSGMERVRDELLDSTFNESDFDSYSPTLQKIQKEITDEVLRILKERITANICMAIVELTNTETAEEGETYIG